MARCHFSSCGGTKTKKIVWEGKKISVCDAHADPANTQRKRPKK